MAQSSSATLSLPVSTSALRARAAVFAPFFSAALALSSVARAETPPADAVSVDAPAPASITTTNAAPAPVAPPPVAPPVTVAAPPSAAHSTPQPARVHEGFYLRLSSGPSVATLRGHGPAGSATITGGGESGLFAIGGALAPGLVLAGTVQGTGLSSDFKGGPLADATVTADGETRSASRKAQVGVGMVGVLLDWYPRPTLGWHAGIATGIGAVAVTNLADDSKLAGVNFAGSLFGGYDWALGHDWALGLQLTASGATSAKLLEDPGAHQTGYRLTPISFGVQASVLYF